MKARARVAVGAATVACLGILATVATTAQETAKTETGAESTTTPQFDGKWRYRMNCAGCHGNDGTGYYAFGPALKGNAFVQNAPASALIQVIQKGRNYKERSHLAYVGMPAYQWIRGGEAEALVQYMKGDLQK